MIKTPPSVKVSNFDKGYKKTINQYFFCLLLQQIKSNVNRSK